MEAVAATGAPQLAKPPSSPPMTHENLSGWLAELRAALALELNSAAGAQAQSRPQWPIIVGVVFLIGFALGLFRLVGGLWTVRSFRQQSRPVEDESLRGLVVELCAELGCRREIGLMEAKVLTSPATVGWRRPVILLPVDWQSWTQQERRARARA